MSYDPKILQINAEHLVRVGAQAVNDRLARPGATDAHAKSSETDHVTACDLASAAAIRQTAREMWGSTIDYSFTEEESPVEPGRPGGVRVIVDPVDGTANLHAGAPEFGVSVALAVDDSVLAGAVMEPATGRLYSASRGNGAWIYDPNVVAQKRRINARVGRPLAQRLVATGFSYLAAERGPQAAVLTRMIAEVADVRRVGSAVMDLCRVADGTYGAYWEHYLHEWDWAAGLLICEEAGAMVNWPGTGGPAASLGDPIVAAAPEIAEDLLQLLEFAGASELARRADRTPDRWVAGRAS